MKAPAPVLYIVIGVLAVLFLIEKCSKPPVVIPTIPPAVADSIRDLTRRTALLDSQRVAADSIAAALRLFAQAQSDRARSAERAAGIARRGADSVRLALDSAKSAADSIPILVAVVAKQDTVIAHQDSALTAEKQVSLALRAEVGVIAQSRDSLRVNRDEWKGIAEREQGLLLDAQKQMANMEPRCEILGIIRCPSRVASAGIAAIVTALVMANISK